MNRTLLSHALIAVVLAVTLGGCRELGFLGDFISPTAPPPTIVAGPEPDDVVEEPVELPDPPTPGFRATVASDGLTVAFRDASSGDPTSWLWDFGDATAPVTEQNPTHAYVVAGTYPVTLQVCNAGGCRSTSAAVVVPGPAP